MDYFFSLTLILCVCAHAHVRVHFVIGMHRPHWAWLPSTILKVYFPASGHYLQLQCCHGQKRHRLINHCQYWFLFARWGFWTVKLEIICIRLYFLVLCHQKDLFSILVTVHKYPGNNGVWLSGIDAFICIQQVYTEHLFQYMNYIELRILGCFHSSPNLFRTLLVTCR